MFRYPKPKVKKTPKSQRKLINSRKENRYREQKYVIDAYTAMAKPKHYNMAKIFKSKLTKKATGSEALFRNILSGLKIRYEFQHIVFVKGFKFFILDFYLPDYNIGIEIDGGYHFTEEQYLKDCERTDAILKDIKLRDIVRIYNSTISTDSNFIEYMSDLLNSYGKSLVPLSEFLDTIYDKPKMKNMRVVEKDTLKPPPKRDSWIKNKQNT